MKKALRELYLPPARPTIVGVPAMTFVMVDGAGDPNDEQGAYARAIQALYSLTCTITMSPRAGRVPEGFFEFAVPPLEGLWTLPLEQFDGGHVPKDALTWTSMIRLPEFVTGEVLDWACAQVAGKKKDVDISRARLEIWTEGLHHRSGEPEGRLGVLTVLGRHAPPVLLPSLAQRGVPRRHDGVVTELRDAVREQLRVPALALPPVELRVVVGARKHEHGVVGKQIGDDPVEPLVRLHGVRPPARPRLLPGLLPRRHRGAPFDVHQCSTPEAVRQ